MIYTIFHSNQFDLYDSRSSFSSAENRIKKMNKLLRKKLVPTKLFKTKLLQSLLPGPVSTAGTNNPPPNFMLPSSEDFAKSLLSTVGKERSTFGCWSHSLQVVKISEFSVKLRLVL